MEQPEAKPEGEVQPQAEAPQAAPEQPPEDPMEKFLTLTEKEKNISEEIINDIISYLYTNGLILKSKPTGVAHLPINLYPGAIQKSLFEKIYFYQIAFNKILNKMSEDQQYVEKVLEPIQDSFMKKLFEISKKSFAYEHKQKIKLNFFRNDYLFDKDQKFLILKQISTIKTPCGTFTDRLKNLYNYFQNKFPEIFEKYKDKEIPMTKGSSVEKFSEAIIEAIKLAFGQNYKDTAMVFVINKNDQNIFAREAIINELYEKNKMKCKLMTLGEIGKKCQQDTEGNLTINGEKISLFYFLTGDKEEDYEDEEAWKGKEMAELSTAIKVPDINTLLCSSKLFQYMLSKPDLSMHYCLNELILNDILRFFGGIYYVKDMDKEKQKELYEKIKANPEQFKLTPFFNKKGEDITGEGLKNILPEGEAEPGEKLCQGVIVEKVECPEHETMSIIKEKTVVQKAVSEYSIFGIILTNDKNLVMNKSVSYFIRTKAKELMDQEACVVDGNAAVDLPCLIDAKVEPNLKHKIEVTAEEIQKYLDDLKAAEEAKKKAEEEAKKKAEEEEARKKAEEEEKKKAEEANATSTEAKPEGEAPKTEG